MHYKQFLHKNEVLIFILHRTWVGYLGRILFLLFLISCTSFFSVPLWQRSAATRGVFFFLVVSVFIQSISLWLRYAYNAVLVTDNRVIMVTQTSLFKRRVIDTLLTRISNIQWERRGFFEWVFRHGGVTLFVEGMKRPVRIRPIIHPRKVFAYLTRLVAVVSH